MFKGMENDKGLVMKSPAAHHAISALFDSPIDNDGKTLVVQYEVKLQSRLECAGAYLKLLTESKSGIQAEEFSDQTPYTIMFGPDKCGAKNQVHFIFRHKNPSSGEYEEKHLTAPPLALASDMLTTLYTLIVRPDQTFSILINNESVKEGSLLKDFDPAVNPPEEIEDPVDEKPSNWVEEALIPDPEASKPNDWDEDAPIEIVDEEAEIPDDWLEDEPLMIPDPEAEQPIDWDSEEDGDWIAPTIMNPQCEEVSGCGPWTKPSKRNPEYKGKWSPRQIPNPDYIGTWSPRMIPNPDYFQDENPAKFEKMAGIGFELWTMQSDILFNNIYIGHSESDAKALAEESWKIKYDAEVKVQEASAPPSPAGSSFKDSPISYVRGQVNDFFEIASQDLMSAFKLKPLVAGGLVAGVTTLVALIGGLIGLLLAPSTTPKPTPTRADAIAKKQVVEEVKDIVPEVPVASDDTTKEADDTPVAAAAKRKSARRAD